MNARRSGNVHVLQFVTGDDIVPQFLDYLDRENVRAGFFIGLGALSYVELGWYELPTKTYHYDELTEDVEVASLVGNVAVRDGKPAIHAHIVVSRKDKSTLGGHLQAARAGAVLEVTLTAVDMDLHRAYDERTGLPQLQL